MRAMAWWTVAILLATVTGVEAEDWPQWMGPKRDSVYRESGLVSEFPADGLPVKWRVPVELGYSGPAVANGKVYVMDYVRTAGRITNNPGGTDRLEGRERVLCLNAESGELIWKHEYNRPYQLSYPAGPRATPTVADGKVYTLGAEGDLMCLNAENGELIWHQPLTERYNTKTPIWGFAAHPLVHEKLVYTMVGGPGSVVVAFNKDTGEEAWKALDAPEPGYCPPSIIEHAGMKQLVVWHPEAMVGMHPATGEVFWSFPLKPSYGMSITAPRQVDDTLFACGIGDAAALVRLAPDGRGASEVWRGRTNNALYTSNSTPFVHEGVIYGADINSGTLMAARLSNAERLWQTAEPTGGQPRLRHATAFIVKHEDRFFLFNERGDLILARLTPEGYHEISRFHVLEPTGETFGRPVVWSHPAFAMKSVFARNDKELVRVNLAADD